MPRFAGCRTAHGFRCTCECGPASRRARGAPERGPRRSGRPEWWPRCAESPSDWSSTRRPGGGPRTRREKRSKGLLKGREMLMLMRMRMRMQMLTLMLMQLMRRQKQLLAKLRPKRNIEETIEWTTAHSAHSAHPIVQCEFALARDLQMLLPAPCSWLKMTMALLMAKYQYLTVN